jgi:hypothetical protein
LKELNLCDNTINDIGCKHLSNLLEHNKSLKILNIDSNDIGSYGLKLLTESLKYNNTLDEIWLCNNNLDIIDCECIIKLLKYNHTLKDIQMDNINSNSLIKSLLRMNTKLYHKYEQLRLVSRCKDQYIYGCNRYVIHKIIHYMYNS